MRTITRCSLLAATALTGTAAPALADPTLAAPGLTAAAPAPAGAPAPATRARVAFGGDLYVALVDDGEELDGGLFPTGSFSVTYGDGRGLDFEARISSVLIVSEVEAGGRFYLGDGGLRPFATAGLGCGMFTVEPVVLAASAGAGVEIGRHLELSGAYLVLVDDTAVALPRVSLAVRF